MKRKFTLIELISVIIILGILSMMIIPNISNFQEDSMIIATKSNVRNIQTAVDNYFLKNNYYPTINQPILGNPSFIKWEELEPKYIRKKPKDIDKIYYWVDSFGEVWASDIDSPNDLKLEGQYNVTWTHVKGTSKYEIGYISQTSNLGNINNSTYKWLGEKTPNSDEEVLLTFTSMIDLTDKIVIIKPTSKIGLTGVPTSIDYEGISTPIENSPPTGEQANILNDTDGDGYKEIWYLEQLKYIETDSITLSQNYELMRNLNFKDDNSYLDPTLNKPLWTTGEGWKPLGKFLEGYYTSSGQFEGDFEGNNYSISNLYINRPAGNNVALFTGILGSFKNITVKDSNITGGGRTASLFGTIYCSTSTIENSFSINNKIKGRIESAGFVGLSYGEIKNSAAINIDVIGDGINIGGFIGENEGTIIQSFATGKVENIYTTDSTSMMTGGFVGRNNEIIKDSYADVITINSSTYGHLGGFVGYAWMSTIENCYSVGQVIQNTNGSTEGFMGWNYSETIIDSYWDIESSGRTTSEGAEIGLTTEQMKDSGNYNYWDFENIWTINSSINNGYPYLRNFGDNIN